MEPNKCPQTIKAIFASWQTRPRTELVEEGRVYLIPIAEILDNGFYKVYRNEAKALAPGKVRNRTVEDEEAGKAKYRQIRKSLEQSGFDPLRPMTFLVRKTPGKTLLHQGHHRLAAAHEAGIEHVPVLFLFDRQH